MVSAKLGWDAGLGAFEDLWNMGKWKIHRIHKREVDEYVTKGFFPLYRASESLGMFVTNVSY